MTLIGEELTTHAMLDKVFSISSSRRPEKACPECHIPPTALRAIPITWPFAVWGLDMVGPLNGGSHKKKYLLVMVDKFTKWIEAKPVKTAEVGPVIDFIST